MREIKFRQWYKNQFHYFRYTDGLIQGPCSAPLERDPIEQFTGLLDMNGKEIYEGDILYFNQQDYNGIDHFSKLPVEYFGSGFYCRKENEYEVVMCASLDEISANDDEIEVIGNIHEKPELLETK